MSKATVRVTGEGFPPPYMDVTVSRVPCVGEFMDIYDRDFKVVRVCHISQSMSGLAARVEVKRNDAS